MDKSILDFAMIGSVILGYFVSIALVTTSFYKSRANNYLALSLFLITSLNFLECFRSKSYLSFEVLMNFRLDFLFAATFFAYFLIQLKHKYLSSRWYKWLYLPFFGSVILEVLLFSFDLYGSPIDVFTFFAKDSASIVLNTALIFCGRHLVRNSKTISENKRHWLLRLNLYIICIIASWILTRIEFHIFDSAYTVYVLLILLSLFLWWVLYYGIFNLQIIAQKEEIHDHLGTKKIHATPTKKKIKSNTSSKITTQLYKLMEDEELYKNPLLSRLDLATQLGTSEGYLSQIINQEINKSVIQFVNEYRVEAAKRLLHNPLFNKYSVEAIGMEAGFKSKSAFYNVFKSSLEMSPGAYRKLQKTS